MNLINTFIFQIIVGHQKIDEVEMNIEQTTIGLVRK